MAPERTDDILTFLDEVHGDGLTRRQATVDSAVGHVERASQAYTGLRNLTEKGTTKTPTQRITLPEGAVVSDGPSAAEPVAIEVTVTTVGPLPDAPEVGEETQVYVSAPPAVPEKPAKREPVDPIDVISGDGANFRERGHTQTHIIRRPKKWFGRR